MLGMMDDDKKITQAILEMPEGPEEPKNTAESEEEVLVGKIFQAMKSGNKKAGKEALKSFITMCMNDHGEDEDEGPELDNDY
jgi:hypothetical protein